MSEHDLAQPQQSKHPKLRSLSGAKPTASTMHIGNYIGAIRNWVQRQYEYDCFYFVPDLHAITVDWDPAELAINTRRVMAQYLAAGIDPNQATLYAQSHVPEHAQLAWVFNCMTGFGEASRMTQFKDKAQKGGAEASTVGFFAYPMLMAADILLYDADVVPVGNDQQQHLELTRNLAARFNRRFGETFTVPAGQMQEESARIYDLQNPTVKMSKTSESPNGTINLNDDSSTIAKKVKSAVTDGGNEIVFDRETKPGVANLLSMYSSLANKPIDDIVSEYEGKMYGHLKVDLADLMVATIEPIRARTLEFEANPEELDALIALGATKARAYAKPKLDEVYNKVGFLPKASIPHNIATAAEY